LEAEKDQLKFLFSAFDHYQKVAGETLEAAEAWEQTEEAWDKIKQELKS